MKPESSGKMTIEDAKKPENGTVHKGCSDKAWEPKGIKTAPSLGQPSVSATIKTN